jgi:hypothetical protein
MSPKSRGRPKGRGRPIKKRHLATTRPLTLHERVMIEAAVYLGHDAPRVTAETAASQWLGEAWVSADMGERHAERDLVEALVGELSGPRDNAAYLALVALATIAEPDERDRIQEHVASSGLRLIPLWSGEDKAQPQSAWRASDVYGSVISIFVAYGGQEPHELAVNLRTIGGLWVEHISLLEPGSHDFEGVTGTGTAAVEITPEQALSEIAEALMVTDLYWPRQSDPGYTEMRAVAHARSRSFAVRSDRQPISDDERHDLIESFVSENDVVAPEDVLRVLADTFIDFGDGYLPGGVLAWSPGEVERFLTDWVVRKVILDAEDRAALPAALRAWLVFALRRRGLQEQDIAPVIAAVEELADEFLDAFDDESAWGTGKQVMTALLERGVDLPDKDAVAAAVRAYNAEQLARRLQESMESRG